MLKEFAEKNGMFQYEYYVDDGYTGRNFNRPAFQRMIADIEAGKIGCVITKDLSRLGRNYIEAGSYIEIFFPMQGLCPSLQTEFPGGGVVLSALSFQPFQKVRELGFKMGEETACGGFSV